MSGMFQAVCQRRTTRERVKVRSQHPLEARVLSSECAFAAALAAAKSASGTSSTPSSNSNKSGGDSVMGAAIIGQRTGDHVHDSLPGPRRAGTRLGACTASWLLSRTGSRMYRLCPSGKTHTGAP